MCGFARRLSGFGRVLERVDGCLGRTLLKAFAIPLLIGGLFGTYHGLNQVWTAWSARGWPTTEGEVFHSRLNGRAFDVRYRYAVDGVALESTRVHVGQFSGMEGYARAIASRYRTGGPVVVYYDPALPSSAVLEHRVPWMSLLLTVIGVVLLSAAWVCIRSRTGLSELMSQQY